MELHLRSEAFAEGAPIPKRYTCEGDDISPPFLWGGAPAETRSYALICNDPDAPGKTFTHWGIYNIPADVSSLEEGHSKFKQPSIYSEGVNDFGQSNYRGPCPPPKHGIHRYHFLLLALGVEGLDLPEGATVASVEQAAREHLLVEAKLIGTYRR